VRQRAYDREGYGSSAPTYDRDYGPH
jgi:hypothetical protein